MIDVTFIRQGATPFIEVTAIGEEIQNATVYVTIAQGDVQITKTNKHDNPAVSVEADGEDTKITVILSQRDTLMLRPGSGRVQVRWIFEDGTAGASDFGYVEVGETIYREVISYG